MPARPTEADRHRSICGSLSFVRDSSSLILCAGKGLVWRWRHGRILAPRRPGEIDLIVAWGDNAVGTAEGLLLHPHAGKYTSAHGACPAEPHTSQHRAARGGGTVRGRSVRCARPSARRCTLTTHELPSLKSCGPVERGVDCTQMTLLRASSVEGSRPAAGRKKLLLYRWRQGGQDAGGFEPLSEVSLPEPMRWMAWCGDEKLWVAMKQRYATCTSRRARWPTSCLWGAAGGGKEAVRAAATPAVLRRA